MPFLNFIGYIMIVIAVMPGGVFVSSLRKNTSGVRTEPIEYEALIWTILLVVIGIILMRL